ncbi:MAG: hypothetical protein ACUVXD_17135 [Thermodesulfobacteriota bacterium]
MSKFLFWQRGLLGLGIGISLFGLWMALLSGTHLFAFFHRQIDPAFWGVSPVDVAARQFQQWIYGAWGATIAGWGIVLIYIVRYPFRKKESWAWKGLVYALLVWYVLDTSLSVLYRVYFNVALNTGLLVLAAVPLVFTRKEFV